MRNTDARSRRSALGMFLMLLRNNIAFNFSTTQQVVSQAIDSVSIALANNFVLNYLGYHHITREEALQKHSIKLTSNVLNKSEDCLCLIADGTYNYIEKPADHELQRKTFMAQEKEFIEATIHCHLVIFSKLLDQTRRLLFGSLGAKG